MPVHRHFLGWDRPCLERAAELLLERYGLPRRREADLRNVVVVVPSGRAGRRLEEMLAAGAEESGLRLIPPRVITPGGLGELLVKHDLPPAGELARQVAWAAALRGADRGVLQCVVPQPPEPENTLAWAALAEQLDRMHVELAGSGMGFEDVAREGEGLPDFVDGDRWRAIAAVQAAYLEHLDEMGLADPQRAIWDALEGEAADDGRDIFLIAAADLNVLHRRVVDRVAERATVLIHAPEDRADWFDEYGCLVVERWCEGGVELRDGQVEMVDRPADQAAAVAAASAKLDGRYAAEQVVVGVCDQQVGVYLEQHLPGYGLPVRNAAGLAMNRTRPVRLLGAAAEWLDRQRFADFATLIRHPDVERWLLDQPGEHAAARQGAVEDWLSLMDRYYQDHLQTQVTGRWLGRDENRGRLKRVYDEVGELMGELNGEARPLNQWAQPILRLVLSVYGGSPLDRRDPAQRVIVEACDRLRDVLEEMHELKEPGKRREPGGSGDPGAGSGAVKISAAQALRVVVRQVERCEPIPPEPDEAAIELLGLLELQLDDAPVLIVTGFNEGFLPSSVNADAFLPDSLRRHLGVLHNERRYARDAYALSAMLASRPTVKLIAGRHTADGDPLFPSRLLFACDDQTTARRVTLFFGSEPAATVRTPGSGRLRPGRAVSDFPIPQPPGPLAEPITGLSVTVFRDYLACPYRFYLRRVLGLKSIDDLAEELDGGAFGDLAHAVLCGFGQGDARDATDPKTIHRDLCGQLDEAVRQKYGAAPLAAVRVQVEQLQYRFEAFADWQAKRAADGWRIGHAELAVHREEPAAFPVDGQPFSLHGRIDRIDIHEPSGRVVIFDYKTSDNASHPDKTHRKGEQWVDLQLPLYRYLARHVGIEGAPDLGYIALPKDAKGVGGVLVEWDESTLCEADEVARQVVRDIRSEIFYPPADPPPPFFGAFAAICQEGRLTEAVAAERAGEEL